MYDPPAFRAESSALVCLPQLRPVTFAPFSSHSSASMRRLTASAALLLLLLCLSLLLLTTPVLAQTQDAAEDDSLVTAEITPTLSASDDPFTSTPPASTKKRSSRKLSDFEAIPDPSPSSPSSPSPSLSPPKRATSSPLPPSPDPFTSPSPSSSFPPDPSRLSFPPLASLLPEAFGLFLILAYVANYVYGLRRNDAIAHAYLAPLIPVLSSHFHSLSAFDPATLASPSCYPLPSHPSSVRVYKDSPTTYHVHCTGRRHTSGLLLTLQLVPRQDLFSLLLSFFSLVPSTDTLTLDCQLDRCPPVVVALTVKKYQARMKKNVADLKLFTNVCRPAQLTLPAHLTLMADTAEGAEAVLGGDSGAVLAKWGEQVVLLHVSDQAMASPESGNRKVMHLKLYVGEGVGGGGGKAGGRGGEGEGEVALVGWMCGLIDRVAGASLSSAAYDKAMALRRAAELMEAKKEEKEREKDREKKPMSKQKQEKLAAKAKKPKVKLIK